MKNGFFVEAAKIILSGVFLVTAAAFLSEALAR